MFLTVVFTLLLWIPNGICQKESSGKKNSSVKPYYAVEANLGISTAYENKSLTLSEMESNLACKTIAFGTNFVGGIELAHYFKVGLGLGYFYYKQHDKRLPYLTFYMPCSMTTHGIPLFVYLRSDFLDRKISPYMDIKIGNNFLITKETIDYGGSLHPPIKPLIENLGTFKLKNGLFLASNIGVAFKTDRKVTVNLYIGYQYVSRNYDVSYGVDGPNDTNIEYAKTGNITVDHQFLLGVGVSF